MTRALKMFLAACLAFSAPLHGQSSCDAACSSSLLTASDDALPEAPQPSFAQAADAEEKAGKVTVMGAPKRVVGDEWHVLTSPARVRRSDLRWLLPLAGAAAVTLATDTRTMRDVVSRDPGFNSANSTASDVLRDAAIGIPVAMFAYGVGRHDDETREAGLLGGEAMLSAYAFDELIKFATLRERPSQDNARGQFFTGDAASDPSFISGHSIVAWSSAAVLAEEYSRPWQQITIYSLASGVSLTRVLGQQHFPTDTLLGSASGWLIGHYVYKAHHRARKHIRKS